MWWVFSLPSVHSTQPPWIHMFFTVWQCGQFQCATSILESRSRALGDASWCQGHNQEHMIRKGFRCALEVQAAGHLKSIPEYKKRQKLDFRVNLWKPWSRHRRTIVLEQPKLQYLELLVVRDTPSVNGENIPKLKVFSILGAFLTSRTLQSHHFRLPIARARLLKFWPVNVSKVQEATSLLRLLIDDRSCLWSSYCMGLACNNGAMGTICDSWTGFLYPHKDGQCSQLSNILSGWRFQHWVEWWQMEGHDRCGGDELHESNKSKCEWDCCPHATTARDGSRKEGRAGSKARGCGLPVITGQKAIRCTWCRTTLGRTARLTLSSPEWAPRLQRLHHPDFAWILQNESEVNIWDPTTQEMPGQQVYLLAQLSHASGWAKSSKNCSGERLWPLINMLQLQES